MPKQVFSPAQEIAVVEMYENGKGTHSIAKEFGVSADTVHRTLKKNGVTMRPIGHYRKYPVNHRFFSTIDTEEKAYWLGFLMADGCVTGNEVKIALAEKDASHLRKFGEAIGSSAPVKIFERTFKMPQGTQHTGRYASINVSSRPMLKDLARVGVVPRKSLIAKAWQGPENLMRHFWRGVIDGDGCVEKRKRNDRMMGGFEWGVGLVGSEDIVSSFANWCRPICGTRSNIRKVGNIWQFRVGGFHAPRKIIKELYGGCTVALDRKHEIAVELINSTQLGVDFLANLHEMTEDGLYPVTCPRCETTRYNKSRPQRRRGGRCPDCRQSTGPYIPDDALKEKYEQGFSTTEIGKMFNIDSSTVWKRVVKSGCKMRTLSESVTLQALRNPKHPFSDKTILEAYESGLSCYGIKKKYGIPPRTAHAMIIRAGGKPRSRTEARQLRAARAKIKKQE